jgi:hypothetical protein
MPVMFSVNATIDRIGTEVLTTAGSAGVSVHRLGIWADNSGVPGTLLVDAGTVATDSTGLKEITISQAVTANTLYWLGIVQQGSPAVTAGLRTTFQMTNVIMVTNPGYGQLGFQLSGVTGALGSNPAVSTSSNGTGNPRIFVRIT